MATLTLWVGPRVPVEAGEAVVAYGTQHWPDITWQIEQAHEVSGVLQEPTLALLAPEDPIPPMDPAEGSVLWWFWEENEGLGLSPALTSALQAHIGRLIAPRQGKPPSRTQALPTHLSRAALLRLPRPVPQPLPHIPRVSADRCLRAKGCTACTVACESEALSFSSQGPAVQVDRCQQCGVCVAACPTGAIQSATVSDGQWRGLIQGLQTAEVPVPLTVGCLQEPENPVAGVQLTVGCIGELGWLPLWELAAADLSEQVTLTCTDQQCPKRPAAAAAEARWDRVRRVMALSPDSTKADGDRSHDLRDTGAMRVTWRWPALIQAVRAVTQGISEVILQQPDDPPMGFRVALKSVDDRTCTLCEGCVNQCPSQALQVEKTPYGEMRRLRVNTSRCLGCGACVAACSEQVLAVEPDQSMMAVTTTEWTTLFADEVLRCRGCGAPLESAAFIHHVASTLQQHGFDPDALHHLQWCPACKDRQLFAPAAE